MDWELICAWILASVQCLGAIVASVFVQNMPKSMAFTDDDLDVQGGDGEYDDLEEHETLTGPKEKPPGRLRNRRRRLAVFCTVFHFTTSILILTAAFRQDLIPTACVAVFFGLLIAGYECVVWNFDIPGLSVHNQIAPPSRLLTVCLTAATNSAPLAFICLFLATKSVVWTALFFFIVGYYLFVQMQYWWAPYFFGSAPHENVERYLAAAEGLVFQLPQLKDHPIRPDLEHTILFVFTIIFFLASAWTFVVSIVWGTETVVYDDNTLAPLGS
eukprot:NODE_2611_length_1078_cov_9.674441_g2174_i0.p1 GENE.NODE_2611_length_1078_cov_9.674441_g2174_i0~~NODE_2611_length_1078_cov_9.674441_g2174_i0.p1  ORF type:complete len:272 (-),score=23.08 NODE_2611_length_1078_cov_9.674441_g2174_i0:26-841(-)